MKNENPTPKLATIARIASFGIEAPSNVYDYNEVYPAAMRAIESLAVMCESVSDDAAIDYWLDCFVTNFERQGRCDPAEHAENVEKMRKYEAEHDFDVVVTGEGYADSVRRYAWLDYEEWALPRVKSAIEFLAGTGVVDECGALDALRSGVQFDHLFGL